MQANPKPRQKLSQVSSWNETLETPTWENKEPGKKHIERRKKWQSMKMTEYLLKEVFLNYIFSFSITHMA